MDRRAFLGGAAFVGLGGLVPGVAEAGESLHKESLRLRTQWDLQKAHFLETLLADRRGAVDSALAPIANHMGDGLAALAVVKELESLPVEDQVHPSIQTLLEDVAVAMGACVMATISITESFLENEDPQKELHLRAALRTIRASLRSWQTSLGRQQALDAVLERLDENRRPGSLLAVLRDELKRAKQAMGLAERMASHESGLLDSPDPKLRSTVERAQEKWGKEAYLGGPRRSGGSGRMSVTRVLGVLAVSILVPVGLVITVGGVCALACGGRGAIFIFLLGLALLGLGIWGGIAWLGPTSPPAEDSSESYGARPILDEEFLAVTAADGWLSTPLVRKVGCTIAVSATGMVRLPGTWLADADGNGVAAEPGALVVGAPLGALVGRVGDQPFFLGRDGQVPEGPEGALELAINQVQGTENKKAIGHFVVRLGSLTVEPVEGVDGAASTLSPAATG